MTITFYSEVWLSLVVYRDAWNWKQKLRANSIDNKFFLRCSIESGNISRHSKLNIEDLSKFKFKFSIESRNISRCSKLKMEACKKCKTIITINSNVRLSPVLYRDTQNWKQRLWGNSNNNNFLLGCQIEAINNSRRSKLNTEALSKFKQQ